MIRIEKLSKSFETSGEKIWALRDISLQINEGEIFGIIGLSGAGKSTLIRCINRLEEPTSGKIYIDGIDITSLDKKALRKSRKDMAMIFQHFNLLNQKTVYKNVAFPLELERLPKKVIDDRVNTLLEYVGLSDKRDAYPSQLSGGQKQRVAIARALANNPKILLSDEGTSALDPKTTKSILELLNRIRKELNVTIILITHQMEVIKDICDRVAIIEDGRIIEMNTVEELFKNPKTKTAKSFISSLNPNDDNGLIKPENYDGTLIRLSYLGKSAKKPIVSQMVKKFNIHVNILSGNINQLMSTSAGYLILELSGSDEEIVNAIAFLKSKDVGVEVI
ncbi:methionine ABC transporter ATP-binding protein [Tepidimicrobium xylanilyticum]|uniref:D-methionine transport system ATP-binding protein n=1 Tax=Tepidimicrobium xylanilyticum TaxID=1123352 RepID=A0A1H3B440_9FIRM|nr:methionine ABC transporter ATP-binding protein [Tepidimicrobium xylanilyticum]GMG97003.1 methionine import ATP-binding protein MetN [Tepidimicrobium xylanilyticum]SDX36702.1 D-methionine transport system ATP-binding protein [Tepidimicrobium xylanilyticum]